MTTTPDPKERMSTTTVQLFVLAESIDVDEAAANDRLGGAPASAVAAADLVVTSTGNIVKDRTVALAGVVGEAFAATIVKSMHKGRLRRMGLVHATTWGEMPAAPLDESVLVGDIQDALRSLGHLTMRPEEASARVLEHLRNRCGWTVTR